MIMLYLSIGTKRHFTKTSTRFLYAAGCLVQRKPQLNKILT